MFSFLVVRYPGSTPARVIDWEAFPLAKKWTKTTLQLAKDHKWTGTPGFSVFVADRGAVRFEYPSDWIVTPDDDADIKFYDQQPPDDLCIIRLSLLRLRPDLDWTGLPLSQLLRAMTDESEQITLSRSEPVLIRRQNLEIAQREARFIDPIEHREAVTHAALARSGTIMPFITCEFWPEDSARFSAVWDHLIETLRLGEYIKDPRVGAAPQRYG
jgi:hypothetical protein